MHYPEIVPGSTALGFSLDSEHSLGCQCKDYSVYKKFTILLFLSDFAFIEKPILARVNQTELAYELYMAIIASRMRNICIVVVRSESRAVKTRLHSERTWNCLVMTNQ